MLLDEPFGALDAKVRKELRATLRHLHEQVNALPNSGGDLPNPRVNVTTIFVTHDQEEAMELADRIVVINKGRVEQVGTPAEIYDNPATPFVMSFVGSVNVLPSTSGIFHRQSFKSPSSQVFLRPHDVLIQSKPEETSTPARINRIVHLGWEVEVKLSLKDGQEVIAYITREDLDRLQLQPGQKVYIKPRKTKAFASVA